MNFLTQGALSGSMPEMECETILDLRVNRVSMDQALEAIQGFIAARVPRHVVTADASMAIIARGDRDLHSIVERADLITPDGAGILWASKLLGFPLRHKVSGVDMVGKLCALSVEHGYRLYFLGAAPGVAQAAADKLRIAYPGTQIVGLHDGYFTKEQEPALLEEISAAKPDVLLVAFGIPKQEKWIDAHKSSLGVPVSIGIGGSFDVYSGLVQRAPLWMQRNGLEWLHRLSKNPKKIGKVMTLPQFALLILRRKIFGR